MKEIVLASNNKGKIREFKEILSKLNINVLPQSEFNVPDTEETGLSFIENAILKARNCCKYTGLPSIADDSGLKVFALNGEPGIYSARYAGQHSNDLANIEKLLGKLKNSSDTNARFVCAIAYLKHATDPTPMISLGTLDGKIISQPIGAQGFGYDSIFLLPKLQKTLAQITIQEKNLYSHRAKALNNFLSNLKNDNDT
ncbi:RdgB/HAM1 family non-canonical purine NTP pyrophosphatase [Allofrancisella guangzhouensis]|uniref:dITP/XTP pyrophosphatase n=1 Tax=Allofrancisella guangzhouensis TaxID=594679 RepID=A0A0A8E6Z5_9GAMM|nr:RdgB/HAM1 family non-canonical purine NTP pyrophosphatase [Allofrancisella guangzhouensis]AJC49372.1 nucleoside-triphosphate diphosphatase [Allofrancisella guangzhouensis]MBK2026986.1 RdgB/HAM1 family non-canonical purine NTP pyrophosphatase [Allofrancisella guangzhouensis]MBK2043894.1 RdgB/HAM1 family non-canonical purine NTP pyrophosphatase [Allofrancisella guangzhouensis]MBK2044993.1 RdgB/HAM1 family non-canonical purine NTP pyrophosphatase [Allofrancisella guangzhouensis]